MNLHRGYLPGRVGRIGRIEGSISIDGPHAAADGAHLP
jgi:hypothetical protein